MSVIEGPNIIAVFTTSQIPLHFATNNGIGKVVTVKQGHPGPKQTWFVQPVEGEVDVYTITVGIFPPELGTPGFRRERGLNDVLNSPLRGEWRLVPVPGFSDVFYVHPNDHIIGVTELLGTEGSKVVVKTFPVVPEPVVKPAWQFLPVNEER